MTYARINLLTARQLAERIADVEKYLYDITPRASRYRELMDERRTLLKRYKEITTPAP